MEKKFKHKKTGEIITYKDGVIKSGTFVLDMGCEPSSEYWEEVKKTYPIGTKVRDCLGKIYEKKENGWFCPGVLVSLNESEIGEGKRFQIVEERATLFTTEDEVSIKEGDNYWFIWVRGKHLPNYQTLYHPYFVENATKLDLDEYWSKDARFFSTKKAAEDYIINNKPCLSFNDVWNSDFRGIESITFTKEYLKKLVKTKVGL